jgi:hypothetical protein
MENAIYSNFIEENETKTKIVTITTHIDICQTKKIFYLNKYDFFSITRK